MARPTVSIIGRGRLGRSLARACRAAGYPVRARGLGELVFLTVPDRAIRPMAARLARRRLDGKGVVHCSGAHPARWLEAAARAGAMVGVFHPFQSFAGPASSIAGCFCGIEAAPALRLRLYRLARALGAHPFNLARVDRPLYHAAATVMAGGTATLTVVGERLLQRAGVPRARAVAQPLLRGTLRNIAGLGPARALTGPLARGDAPTIALHVRSLSALPEALELYRSLGVLTLQFAVESRRLRRPDADAARVALFAEA